jgi:hypothetical protein
VEDARWALVQVMGLIFVRPARTIRLQNPCSMNSFATQRTKAFLRQPVPSRRLVRGVFLPAQPRPASVSRRSGGRARRGPGHRKLYARLRQQHLWHCDHALRRASAPARAGKWIPQQDILHFGMTWRPADISFPEAKTVRRLRR